MASSPHTYVPVGQTPDPVPIYEVIILDHTEGAFDSSYQSVWKSHKGDPHHL